MPDRDDPENREKATDEKTAHAKEFARGSEMHSVLAALDEIFSTFRNQLRTETPQPFNSTAQTAVDKFNDILAGLALKSRPQPFKIVGKRISHAEIDLTWTDDTNAADGYRVKRCQGHSCTDLDVIAQLSASARAFRDLDAFGESFYRYQVVAFNARGQASSNIVDVAPSAILFEK